MSSFPLLPSPLSPPPLPSSPCSVQENLPRVFEIPVKRRNLFETSHRAIMGAKNKEHLKARLWVVFDGEKGLDYGGVSR